MEKQLPQSVPILIDAPIDMTIPTRTACVSLFTPFNTVPTYSINSDDSCTRFEPLSLQDVFVSTSDADGADDIQIVLYTESDDASSLSTVSSEHADEQLKLIHSSDAQFVRNAKPSDLEALVEIEKLCWSEKLQASSDVIMQRISTNSKNQFVVEKDGVVCGVLYTQRIKTIEELESGTFETQSNLHDPSGPIIQLCAIAVRSSA
jgi:hypothetical protein